MPRVTFIEPNGRRVAVDAAAGETLLEVARHGGVDIEGACGGSLACATCHVSIDNGFFDRLAPPSAEEDDMLDLATGLTATSRLGCQIVVTDGLDGLTVRVIATA